jgi:hypothetical protein
MNFYNLNPDFTGIIVSFPGIASVQQRVHEWMSLWMGVLHNYLFLQPYQLRVIH